MKVATPTQVHAYIYCYIVYTTTAAVSLVVSMHQMSWCCEDGRENRGICGRGEGSWEHLVERKRGRMWDEKREREEC